MTATAPESPAPPPPQKPKGLSCVRCSGVRLAVLDVENPCPGVRIRYRECAECGERMKTREVIVLAD